MEHSKGPWYVTTSNASQQRHPVICVKPACVDVIIAVCGVEGQAFTETARANAALIASAPEMLDALIAIQEAALMDMETGESGLHSRPINELISAVFAKLANEAGV